MQDKCWLYAGTISQDGYGLISSQGKLYRAHRVVYENTHGEIPERAVTDHLCRVRHCINPEHLELVTIAENTRRGNAPSAINGRKTHCNNGHEFTPDNTSNNWKNGKNYRRCKQCVRDRSKRRWQESKFSSG